MGNKNSTGLPSRTKRAGWALRNKLFDARQDNNFDISQPLTAEEQRVWGTSSDQGTGGKTDPTIEQAYALQESKPQLEWAETVVQKAKRHTGNLGNRINFEKVGKAAGSVYVSDIKMIQDPNGYEGQTIPVVDVAIVQTNVPFQMGNRSGTELDVWQHVLITKGELEKAADSVRGEDGAEPKIITTLPHQIHAETGKITGLKSGANPGAQRDLAQQAGQEAQRDAKMGEAVQYFRQAFPPVVFHLRPGSSSAAQSTWTNLTDANFQGTDYNYHEEHQNMDGSITAHAPTVDVYAVNKGALDDRAGQLNFMGSYEIDEESHPELGNKEKEGAFLQYVPNKDFVESLNFAAEATSTVNPFGDKVGKFISFMPTEELVQQDGKITGGAPTLEQLTKEGQVEDVQFKLRQLQNNYGKLGAGRTRLFGRVMPAQNEQSGFSMADTDHHPIKEMVNQPVAAVVMPKGSNDGKKRDAFLNTAQSQFTKGAGGWDKWQATTEAQQMGKTVKHGGKGGGGR